MKENLLPMNVTIDRGNLGRGVIRNWDKFHLNVNHLMHDNWVVYFIQRVKFTKAISQFAWSRNQGRVTSSHAADSVTFAERVQ